MKSKWLYYVIIAVLVFIVIGLCVSVAHAEEPNESESVWTDKMNQLHQMADWARALGYSEDSPIIVALQQAWWSEYNDLAIIAKVGEGEARDCEWEQLLYTCAVVVNRRDSDIFPNTIREVVAAPMQYSTTYLKNFHTVPKRCWLAARDALNGDHDAPSDLYWQAEFPQGKEVWKIFEYRSPYYSSTTYFCRGV